LSQNTPYYDRKEFLKDCASKKGIGFLKTTNTDAFQDAMDFLQLHTKGEILEFIASDQVSEWEFERSEEVRDIQGLLGRQVDSWKFRFGRKVGYIAFVKSSTGWWIIKSCKPHHLMKISDEEMKKTVKRILGNIGYKPK
jgi:hypothetical protein